MIPIVNCKLLIVNLKRDIPFLGFPSEFEREAFVACHAHSLLTLANSNVEGVEANDGLAFLMDFEHELVRLFFGLEEDLAEHFDHKFHGGEVIVVHDDAVHAG